MSDGESDEVINRPEEELSNKLIERESRDYSNVCNSKEALLRKEQNSEAVCKYCVFKYL